MLSITGCNGKPVDVCEGDRDCDDDVDADWLAVWLGVALLLDVAIPLLL